MLDERGNRFYVGGSTAVMDKDFCNVQLRRGAYGRVMDADLGMLCYWWVN